MTCGELSSSVFPWIRVYVHVVLENLAKLFSLMDPNSPERVAFVSRALKWSSGGSGKLGHPRLHQLLALTLWKGRPGAGSAQRAVPGQLPVCVPVAFTGVACCQWMNSWDMRNQEKGSGPSYLHPSHPASFLGCLPQAGL